MTITHTPGPWTVEGWNHDDLRIDHDYVDEGGNRHVGNIGVVDGKRADTNKANARLIAAAPDLLDALRAFCGDYESTPAQLVNLQAAYRHALAAIAKAEGREP